MGKVEGRLGDLEAAAPYLPLSSQTYHPFSPYKRAFLPLDALIRGRDKRTWVTDGGGLFGEHFASTSLMKIDQLFHD